MWALTTGTSLTINDVFNAYPYYNGFADWLLSMTRVGPPSENNTGSIPVGALIKVDDAASYVWNLVKSQSIVDVLRIITQVALYNGNTTRAQTATWLANTKIGFPTVDSVWDIIFNDRTTSANIGLSTVKAFGWNPATNSVDSYLTNSKAGRGDVFMRSSWSFDADTTQAYFRAFPYHYYGHQHLDSLAFSIYKGEYLALIGAGRYYPHYENGHPDTPDNPMSCTNPDPVWGYLCVGTPHHHYYYKRSISSNTLLVLDPNEVIQDPSMAQTYTIKMAVNVPLQIQTVLGGQIFQMELLTGRVKGFRGFQ